MMFTRARHFESFAGLAVILCAASANAQSRLDRADPSLAARAAENALPPPRRADPLQTPSSVSQPSVRGTSYLAGAIRVDGASDVSAALLLQAVTPFIGRTLDDAAMQDLLAAVSHVARSEGYLFAHSSVPPQTLAAGVLRVRLDEGQIDVIETPGDKTNTVRAMLLPLVGRPARQAELERVLMLIGDLPGMTLGQVRYELRGTHGVLIVPVSHRRVTARASLDNRGLATLGPIRALASVDINGVLSQRDTFTVQELITPLAPRELNAVFARYAATVTNSGTELALHGTYASTRPGGAGQQGVSTGESASGGVALSQPLVRSRRVSLWITGEFDTFTLNQWYDGSLARRDRLSTAAVSLNGYVPLAGGRLRAGAGVTHGLDVLGATALGDIYVSRPGASGVFTTANAWGNWVGDLRGPFSARLALAGQLSTKPLLAIEQITIGGPDFGRAFDYSERAGDEGVLGSAELRLKLLDRSGSLLRWAQIYTFGDAGHATNHEDNYGAGNSYSAGGGARLNLSHQFNLQLEAAFPIGVDRYLGETSRPRVNFSIAKSF